MFVSVSSSGCVVDLAFVVDESGSIRDNNVPGQEDNWFVIIDFIESVISSLNVGPDATHIAEVRFG